MVYYDHCVIFPSLASAETIEVGIGRTAVQLARDLGSPQQQAICLS